MENPRQGEDSQEDRKPAETVTQWALGVKHGMVDCHSSWRLLIGGVAMIRRRVTVRTRTVKVPVKVRVKITTTLKRVRRVR